METDLDLALAGNCSFSALIDSRTNVVWSCLPRFDSDPVFDGLLSHGSGNDDKREGIFVFELIDFEKSEQEYVKNSAVVRTRLFDTRGGAVEVTDFAPRFKQFGRTFRPLTLVRMLRRIAGSPRARIKLRPTVIGGDGRLAITHGSNHVRYVMPRHTLRLTTDASITAVLDEIPFVVEHPLTFILGPDETLQERGGRDGATIPGADAGLLERVGALSRDSIRMAERGHSGRHHAEAEFFRRHRRYRRSHDHVDTRGPGQQP